MITLVNVSKTTFHVLSLHLIIQLGSCKLWKEQKAAKRDPKLSLLLNSEKYVLSKLF